MTGTAPLVIAVVLAALILGALSKPGKTLVGGLVYRDKKGRLVLILTPAKQKPRRRR